MEILFSSWSVTTLVSNTKSEKTNIPPRNMIPIAVFYQILLLLGYSILLGGFALGDDILYLLGLKVKFVEWRFDGDFILNYRHYLWLDLVVRHIQLLCWECWGWWRDDLGLNLHYLYLRCCGCGRKSARGWVDEVYNHRVYKWWI